MSARDATESASSASITAEPASGPLIPVQRLSDIDGWEFYALRGPTGVNLVLGLRRLSEFAEVEYEMWSHLGAEPRWSGTVPCTDTDATWPTASRAALIERIVEHATPA